jgi:hypothetical protein
MAGLGIILTWSGYLLAVWGYSKIRSAYNPQGALSLPDCALPSRRATYIAAMQSATVGGVAYTASDTNRLIAEAQAQVTKYCVAGAPTGPGSQCAAAKLSLQTAQQTQAGTAG